MEGVSAPGAQRVKRVGDSKRAAECDVRYREGDERRPSLLLAAGRSKSVY
jgi:hypothetical protein